MQILALHLRSYLEYALLRNVSDKKLPDVLEKIGAADATVSDKEFYEYLEIVDRNLNDELLGIRLAKFLNLNALGLVYQISLQCASVEEGIYYLKNFINATFPVIKIQHYKAGENFVIELKTEGNKPLTDRIIAENVLAIISKELAMMSFVPIPIKLTSPYFNSDYPEDFMSGDSFSISFPDVTLKGALKSYADRQLDFLIPQYLKLIESLKQENTFANKVKTAALNLAKPALPGLNEVADAFNLTPRTFQRILAAEKLNFRQIADDLKKEISVLLLKNNTYSIADVCYLLGYSEPAAFSHSFKKWYGHSPAGARERKAW